MNQALRDELLHRGLSDMLQWAELVSVARRTLPPDSSDAEAAQAVLAVISDLLESKLAIVGDVVGRTDGPLSVRSWGQSNSATAARIASCLGELGRPATLGEVCWLELTEAGRAEARRV
jgi:hypothetical protein